MDSASIDKKKKEGGVQARLDVIISLLQDLLQK